MIQSVNCILNETDSDLEEVWMLLFSVKLLQLSKEQNPVRWTQSSASLLVSVSVEV